MLLGSGEQARSGPRSSAPTTGACAPRLERFVDDPPPTEPCPNDHCGICDFKPALRRVLGRGRPPLAASPGIRRRQIERLARRRDRDARRRSAARRAEPRRPGSPPRRSAKIREQAELQLWAREHGRDRYVLLAAAAGDRLRAPARALARRPLLRLRGQPVLGQGRQPRVPLGDPRRRPQLHAALRRTTTRPSAPRSSSSSTSCTSGSRAYPDLHVYHYAAYEITALKRLMGRYGTREDELDDLLRRGVFVDLLKVVRNGLRASRPGYGLKEMEAFLDFERRRRGQGRRHLDRRLRASGCRRATRRCSTQIDAYNEEDCIATLLLRDWLLERRARGDRAVRAVPAARARRAEAGPRDEGRAGRAARGAARRRRRARRAAARLPRPRAQAGLVGVLRPARDDARRARRGRRVDRPARARRRARAGRSARWPTRSRSRRRSTSSGTGRTSSIPRPASRRARSSSSTATRAGSCSSAARRSRTSPLPRGADPGRAVRHRRPGGRARCASAARCSPATTLPGARVDPATASRSTASIQTTDLEEMKALVLSLDGRHLVIQGPPGSGKTWTSGRLIARPDRARQDASASPRRATRRSTTCSTRSRTRPTRSGSTSAGSRRRAAATPSRTTTGRPDRERHRRGRLRRRATSPPAPPGSSRAPTHDGTLDYLFIDEAGQVSLADALAMGDRARATSCSSATRSSSTR